MMAQGWRFFHGRGSGRRHQAVLNSVYTVF